MDKKPLIVISICAMVLLVLGSLSNVVGYQTVQSSNQTVIKERINQRELLFQTICDIANNKEIQRIILKSQMSGGILPTSELPVITKNQIRQMHFLGMILSKVISNSILCSFLKQNQKKISDVKKKFINIIEKKIKQNRILSALSKSINQHRSLDYPIIDFIVNVFFFVLLIILGISSVVSGFFFIFSSIIVYILDPIDNSNVVKFITMLWAFFGLFWLFVLGVSVIGVFGILNGFMITPPALKQYDIGV